MIILFLCQSVNGSNSDAGGIKVDNNAKRHENYCIAEPGTTGSVFNFICMTAFQILPHTADIRLSVTGGTQEELFSSALKGMSYIQKKDFCKQQDELLFAREKIQAKASDKTGLLIDFLSEVLTLSHINKVVYCEVSFHKLSDTELTATVKGNKVNYFDEDIKAVTYHEAEIKQNKKNQLETVIIFDI